MNRDPIEEWGGGNLYALLNNAPTTFVDPLGLFALDDDGFPVAPTGTVLDAYIYDDETKDFHDQVMEDGWDSLGSFGKELAEEAAMSCLPYGNLAKLKKIAKGLYPRKLGDELHHITPLYLGGHPNGPKVLLPASYHQLITNAFRRRWPYGSRKPTQEELIEIIGDVYPKFPLPKRSSY